MSSTKRDLSGIFMTFLFMIVGLALTPTVTDMVTTAAENLTGAAAAIVDLVPLFWVILIIAIGLAALVSWLKQ